jgi:hypothetical protein
MLDDREREALRRWYAEPEVKDQARKHIENKDWEELEELIQMHSLFRLERREGLPDYLKTDEGQPLLPSLNPRANLEAWQDAIEVGWEVVASELGVQQDDVHRAIGKRQQEDWDSFVRSVEARKRERGQ